MACKKIVHIVEAFGGGVFTYVRDLANGLADEYETVILYGKTKETPENIQSFFSPNIKLTEVLAFNNIRGFNPLKIIKAIFDIKKEIKKANPDVVYLHSSMAGGIGRWATHFLRKEGQGNFLCVYNAHGWAFKVFPGLKGRFYLRMERFLASWTDLIINISQAEYTSALENRVAPESKMITIENSIDFSKWNYNEKGANEVRKKYNIGKNDFIIGMSARLDAPKDPMMLIRAMKRVIQQSPDAKLMLVGAGSLENQVKMYVKENGLENRVIITGRVIDVCDYVSAFDVAVLASSYEGFGLVILEYIACGKPVVATKTGGIVDILPLEMLVEYGDYEMLAEKILHTKKLENLVYREKYDLSVMLEKYRKLFDAKGTSYAVPFDYK